MIQTQLLNEFRQLSISQQLEPPQAAMRTLSEHFIKLGMLENEISSTSPLAVAADLLLKDYLDDEELTSFTVLDGEPIYAEG